MQSHLRVRTTPCTPHPSPSGEHERGIMGISLFGHDSAGKTKRPSAFKSRIAAWAFYSTILNSTIEVEIPISRKVVAECIPCHGE